MKLGIYLESNYFLNDALFCEDIYSLNLNELSSHFDYLFLGRNCSLTNCKYRINKYKSFFEIGYYSSLVSLFTKLPFYILKNNRVIRNFVLASDKLLIMAPSPISLLIIKYAIRYKKEYCILIRQDTRKMIPDRFVGLKKILARLVANYLESTTEKIVKKNNSKVLALGQNISARYSKFTNKVFTFSSSRYKISDIIDELAIRKINTNFQVKILFVGRIEINKGINELLDAIKDFTEIELTVVGDGQYLTTVRLLISKLNLESRVKILGYIPFGPKLMEIYKSHDIFVLPSYSEGLPQVILEAMASGCLVLATNVGGIPHILQHKFNGLLFPPHDSPSIITLLREIKQNKYDLDEMRLNALKTAKHYAFENQSKVLIEAINS